MALTSHIKNESNWSTRSSVANGLEKLENLEKSGNFTVTGKVRERSGNFGNFLENSDWRSYYLFDTGTIVLNEK